MPQIASFKRNNATSGFTRPKTLDREQFEYTFQTTITYGIILFAVLGVATSITYMTIQQLKK
jgi:hypothetical protein